MNKFLHVSYPDFSFETSNEARAWLTRLVQSTLPEKTSPLPDWFRLISGHPNPALPQIGSGDGPYPFRIYRDAFGGLTIEVVGPEAIEAFYPCQTELNRILGSTARRGLNNRSFWGEMNLELSDLHPVRFHQLVLEKQGKNLRETLGEIRLENDDFSFAPITDPRYQNPALLELVRAKLVAGIHRQANRLGLEVPEELVLGQVRITGISLVGVGTGKTLLSAVNGSAETNLYLEGPWALGRLASKGCGRLSLVNQNRANRKK